MRFELVKTDRAGSAGEKDLFPVLQHWRLEREDTGAALLQGGKEGSGTEHSSVQNAATFLR